MEWFMQSLFKGIFLTCFIALSACSEKPAAESAEATESSQAQTLTGGADETRTISIQSPTQCQLIVKRGRKDSETISPKSCQISKSADGFITKVMVQFDPPCKQYTFNNVIGTRYFLDEKTIAGKNKACQIETFNASYSWNVEES